MDEGRFDGASGTRGAGSASFIRTTVLNWSGVFPRSLSIIGLSERGGNGSVTWSLALRAHRERIQIETLIHLGKHGAREKLRQWGRMSSTSAVAVVYTFADFLPVVPTGSLVSTLLSLTLRKRNRPVHKHGLSTRVAWIQDWIANVLTSSLNARSFII